MGDKQGDRDEQEEAVKVGDGVDLGKSLSSA